MADKAEVVQQEAKSPVIAAALSFFITGLGQAYNGELKKGAALFGIQAIITFVLVVLTVIVAFYAQLGALLCLPAFLIPFVIWLIGIYDAYKGAKGEPLLKF